jgi:hypothetical protein
MVELMQKAAGHSYVNISGIAIAILTKTTERGFSLADDLLPLLQRRAIIPHRFVDGSLSLAAYDICGVDFHEFENFRESVLSDALAVCWKSNPAQYMNSCTSAVEEFCKEQPSLELSLQLEAALYCIEAVAEDIFDSHHPFPCTAQLRRCIEALSPKPVSLTSNPLTLGRMCRLIRKVSVFEKRVSGQRKHSLILLRQSTSWLLAEGYLDVAMDLSLSTYLEGISNDASDMIRDAVHESGVSLTSEASLSVRELLNASPKHFSRDSSMNALSSKFRRDNAGQLTTL